MQKKVIGRAWLKNRDMWIARLAEVKEATAVFDSQSLEFRFDEEKTLNSTTDFQSVAWRFSTDWQSVVQISAGKFYSAGRLNATDVTDLSVQYVGKTRRNRGHNRSLFG